MKTAFVKNDTRYMFHYGDNGQDNFITLCVNAVNLEWEKQYRIPVKQADGFAVKINKKSCQADGGAYALFKFIKNCIDQDFMMIYVNKIIDTFATGLV